MEDKVTSSEEGPQDRPIVERIEKLEWQFDFLLRYLNEKDILPDQAILSMNDFVKARMDPKNVRR